LVLIKEITSEEVFKKNKMGKKRRFKKDPNEEIGPKYNIAAWEHFGKTNKLKGGFGFDGEEVEGTMKINRNGKNTKVQFREKGKLKSVLLSNKINSSGI